LSCTDSGAGTATPGTQEADLSAALNSLNLAVEKVSIISKHMFTGRKERSRFPMKRAHYSKNSLKSSKTFKQAVHTHTKT